MKSIWTIMLNVLVRIGQLTQCATRAAVRAVKCADKHVYRAFVSAVARALKTVLKTVLVCAISVAMWLPVCLTAETAVAADNANNSSTSAESANPNSQSGSKSISNSDSQTGSKSNSESSSQPNPSSHQGSVFSNQNPASSNQNPASSAPSAPSSSEYASSQSSSDSSELSSLQGFGNNSVFMDESSPFARALNSLKSRGSSPLERAADDYAKAQNREAKNYTARESYEEYHPGCNKDYALGACITTDGDGAGLRATNGHDLDG